MLSPARQASAQCLRIVGTSVRGSVNVKERVPGGVVRQPEPQAMQVLEQGNKKKKSHGKRISLALARVAGR